MSGRMENVAGKADTDPKVTNDPLSPENRRISIVLLRGQPAGGASAPGAHLPERPTCQRADTGGTNQRATNRPPEMVTKPPPPRRRRSCRSRYGRAAAAAIAPQLLNESPGLGMPTAPTDIRNRCIGWQGADRRPGASPR